MLLLGLLLDVVGEEEGAQDSKHDEELQHNDEPKLLACRGQSSEAIAIGGRLARRNWVLVTQSA